MSIKRIIELSGINEDVSDEEFEKAEKIIREKKITKMIAEGFKYANIKIFNNSSLSINYSEDDDRMAEVILEDNTVSYDNLSKISRLPFVQNMQITLSNDSLEVMFVVPERFDTV